MSNPGNKQPSASTEAGRKRQRNSSVAAAPKQSKQRRSNAAASSVQQQTSSAEQQQSEEAPDDAASSRHLRDLTDFFPETAPPQGRRLTRSLARSLNASSSGSSQTTTTRSSGADDTTVSTQQQQSAGASGGPQQSPGVSSSSAAHSADDAPGPSSSSSAAAASSSRGNKASKKAKAVSKKRLTHTDGKQESSSGTAAGSSSSSRSRRSSVNQADAATANTGICQSIGRSDGNRVFPEQQQQQHHQQQSDQQLQLQRAADEATQAALVQAQFEMAASAGIAHLEQAQRAVGRTPAATAASNFLGTLVPRMQHLLGGAHAQQNVRVAAIMDGLRSSNEIRQSEAATELAEMLLLGNEESLPNLPVKELVQALMVLLQKEHNFELMLTAARCLTNLLEALPRALPIVLDTVPLLLEKLKRIECIDVAEQALTALEVLSRRNGKTIMSAGGIAATISHVDFFSVPSQRLAFQIAANCAMFVTANDFAQVRDSLPELTQRLLVEDKRCLESVCAVFARMVDNLRGHPDKLREIVGPNHGLLTNVQQLLLIQPPAVGSTTFQSLIRMLRYMCAKCSDLAVALVEMGFARTLRFLIIGTEKADAVDFELLNRPPQQLQELVFLAGELLPRLPVDGLFEIDAVMSKSQAAALLDMPTAQWLWKDDNNVWQLYSSFDSRLLEIAFQSHEREVQLQMVGQVYRVDIERLMQINEMTGNARQVQRRATSVANKGTKQQGKEVDKRGEMLKSNRKLSDDVIRLLFPILVEIDGSSSGPAIRYESLRVMLRMIYPSSPKLLQEVLDQLPLAGHIASALASPRSKDLCIVASALQLVHLVTEKLPHIYGSLFRRQGVAHQVEKLANLQMEATPQPSPHVPAKAASSAEHIPPPAAQQPQLLQAPLTRSGHKQHRQQLQNQLSAEEASAVPHKTLRIGGAAGRSPPVYGSHTGEPFASGHLPYDHSDHSHAMSTEKDGDASPLASSPPSADAPTHSSKKEKEAKKKSPAAPFFQSLRLPSWRLPGSASWAAASGGGPSTPSAAASASGGLTLPTVPAPTQPGTSAGRGIIPPPAHHYVGLPAGMRPLPPYGAPLNDAGVLSQQQKEKLRAWIKKEAQYLMATFFRNPDANGNEESPIGKMAEFGQALALLGEDVGSKPLTELKSIFTHNDISAFELNHSGLIEALATYLTSETLEPARNLRLKRFAAVFMGLTPDNLRPSAVGHPWLPFEMLVSKLLAAVAQLEQFHVKVTDMGMLASGGGPVGSLRGASALRFFQTHQIRCALRRHPSCKELREWRRGQGSIKVDPFTSISAIERYLLDRGVGYPRAQGNDDSSGDEDATSDDDEVEGGAEGGAMAAAGQQQRRIEIVINDQKVASHMSILQAIRQYSIPPAISVDMDHVALAAGIWVNTHTLWYRSATDDDAQDSSRDTSENSSAASQKISKKSSISKEKKHKIDDKLWNEGRIPERLSLLDQYLTGRLPTELEDPSVPALTLLRALYGLNRYWWALFADEEVPPSTHAPLLSAAAFHSSKLAAKIGRQLSDFLTVATQQIPKWINDLVWAAPFVVPFSVRRNLLYCTAFGRDRALMHLVNQTEGGQTDGDTGRLTPRLERRKVSIRREDLLRHAEETMQQLGSSRAMLEVGFDGEAGTGFGPTLEFYSTVSKELQRYTLKLWHGEKITLPADHAGGQPVEYVLPGSGLYPTPVSNGMNSKQREARAKKFEFIGRLMAQALIDARMLDLPLSPVFFKWLLCEEKSFCLADMEVLDSSMYQILKRLTDTAATDFENMEMYFTLPGDESFELIKGGKDKAVDKANARQYAELVAHWRLQEGARRDMEAVRRGLESIIDLKQLTLFTPEEMDELFCGCTEESAAGSGAWERGTLQQALKPDHGYSHESQQIKWLVDMLAAYSTDQQRKFLQFVTGSPKLPVGGFKSLNPALTVVKKSGTYGNVDEELPSAMTCYNYLKIPAYSSYQVFVERFDLALRFIYSFHLT